MTLIFFIVNRNEMKKELLKPGMKVPQSAQYKVVWPRWWDAGWYEVTLTKGERIPPSRIVDNARFVQVDKTKHKSK